MSSTKLSAWQQTLAEYAGEGKDRRNDLPLRVVVVGACGSGKRTLISRLCEPTMQRKTAAPSGSGVVFTYLEVRNREGSVQVVELVSCDAPQLLRVAVPSRDVAEKCFVIYAVDAAVPHAALSTLRDWVRDVDEHVAALYTPEERQGLVSARLSEWHRHGDVLAPLRRVHVEAANLFDGAANADTFSLTADTVTLLPSLIAVTRIDVFEKQQKAAAAAKVGELTQTQFFLQSVRQAAVHARSGFAVIAAKNASPVVTSAVRALWEYVCGHLGLLFSSDADSGAAPSSAGDATVAAAAGATGSKSAQDDSRLAFLRAPSLEDAVSLEPGHATILPRGFDSLGHLGAQIVASVHAFEDVFRRTEPPAPRVRKHEEIIREFKFSMNSYSDGEALVWDEMDAPN